MSQCNYNFLLDMIAALNRRMELVENARSAWKPEADTVHALRSECAARNISLEPDDTILEAHAAPLVGWTPKTMKNRRHSDAPIPFITRGRKTFYRLEDLAYRRAHGGK